MEFTNEQRNQYLDQVAQRTQEGIWMTEMGIMKNQEKLAKKKALLTVVEQKLEQKEYESANQGNKEKAIVVEDIATFEAEIAADEAHIENAKEDLILIEQYRIASQAEPDENYG
jgi:hypothetical protein